MANSNVAPSPGGEVFTLKSFISLFLFVLLLAPEYAGIAVWQYFYTKTTVHPAWSPLRSTNVSSDQRGEFAGILIFSALIGFCNLVGFSILLLGPLISSYSSGTLVGARNGKTRSRIVFIIYLIAEILVILFVSMSLFVAPFVAPPLSWKSTYKAACNGLDLWASLDTPETRQTATVVFNNKAYGNKFTMTMSPDPLAGFSSSDIYNFTITHSSAYTGVEWNRIEYDLSRSTYTLHTVDNVVLSQHKFSTGKQFSIPEMNLAGDLELFESRCVFDPTVEIKDARERGGEVVIKSVQFNICSSLIVCGKPELGTDMAVPVGWLVLARARRGGKCCQGKRVPGVEGRDYQ